MNSKVILFCPMNFYAILSIGVVVIAASKVELVIIIIIMMMLVLRIKSQQAK